MLGNRLYTSRAVDDSSLLHIAAPVNFSVTCHVCNADALPVLFFQSILIITYISNYKNDTTESRLVISYLWPLHKRTIQK